MRNSDGRYLRASIDEVAQYITKGREYALHCGYIPISNSAVSIGIQDVDDLSGLLDSGRVDRGNWQTGMIVTRDVLGAKWAHVASASTMVDYHYGPAGLGTYLSPVINSVFVCIPQTAPPLSNNGEEYVVDYNAEWLVIRVDSGWELFIPPRHGYVELNIDDSLTLGGHYYCNELISESLDSITMQHYCRLNPDVPFREYAPMLFLKLLDKFTDVIGNEGSIEELPARYPRDWEQIAALLVLVAHLDQLAPRGCLNPWQSTDEFKRDFAYSRTLFAKLFDGETWYGRSLSNKVVACEARYKTRVHQFNSKCPNDPSIHVKCVRCHEIASDVR